MKVIYTAIAGISFIVAFATLTGCGDAPQPASSQDNQANTNVQQAPPQVSKKVPIDMSLFSGSDPHIPSRFSEDQLRHIYELELGSNDVAEAEHGNGDEYQDEVQHYYGLTDDENMGLAMEAQKQGYMSADASQDFSGLFIEFRKNHLTHHQHHKHPT